MASEPSSTAQPSAASAESVPNDQLTLNLNILSPSVQYLSRPLSFHNVPATTTVRQLKEQIRDALTLRPMPENQRLIYRGHALHQDNTSLLDVFGAETVSPSLLESEALSC
jgi:hypothetical protein